MACPEFRKASERTIDSGADLRWGPDRKGFRRLVHPNGVCLIGQWQITADTGYSGYFAKGRTALVVARYSTCCTDTRRGQTRSLSMVGKLFPTTDPDHAMPLRTANFMTQDDIGGEDTAYINDIELRNAPNTTVARRGLGAPALLQTGLTFDKVDQQPTIRQLYQIAELGKPADEPTRAPEFMRLLVSPDQPRIAGDRPRLPRRDHGADLRPRRSRAKADAHLPRSNSPTKATPPERRSRSAARSATGAVSAPSCSTTLSYRTTATS